MLPSNFDTLAAERPDLAPTLTRIAEWVRRHPDWHLLDPRELARQLRDVDSLSLGFALRFLVQRGILRRVYMVATPSGVLAEGEFTDLRQIPAVLKDRFNNSFDTSDAEIVPVLTAAK